METIYAIALAIHVVGGSLGLLSMGIPLVARKGGKLHKRAGVVFALGMGLVALSGVWMAFSWVLDPARFQPGISARDVRLNGAFLALIGLLTGNALVQAITAIGRKRHPAARPRALELSSLALLASFALGNVALGIIEHHALSLVFGLGSLALVAQDLFFVLRPLPTKMAFWYQHMNAMSTCCTSAITAFLVLGARRYLGEDAFGGNTFLLWLVPSVTIPALFQVWIVWYKRKFEGREKSRERRVSFGVTR